MALLVARRTNDREVAGSRPTKVVCITVLTGNRMGWTARCGRSPLLPSSRKLEFRLSALMDSDLAWVNGKSGRQRWRYADAFQHSIISEAIYHFEHWIWKLAGFGPNPDSGTALMLINWLISTSASCINNVCNKLWDQTHLPVPIDTANDSRNTSSLPPSTCNLSSVVSRFLSLYHLDQ